jgi:hypothetical protein
MTLQRVTATAGGQGATRGTSVEGRAAYRSLDAASLIQRVKGITCGRTESVAGGAFGCWMVAATPDRSDACRRSAVGLSCWMTSPSRPTSNGGRRFQYVYGVTTHELGFPPLGDAVPVQDPWAIRGWSSCMATQARGLWGCASGHSGGARWRGGSGSDADDPGGAGRVEDEPTSNKFGEVVRRQGVAYVHQGETEQVQALPAGGVGAVSSAADSPMLQIRSVNWLRPGAGCQSAGGLGRAGEGWSNLVRVP